MSNNASSTPELDAAVQSEINAQGGGMPTAYVLIASYIDTHGTQRWLARSLTDQGMFATLGIVRFYERLIEDDVMDRTTGRE